MTDRTEMSPQMQRVVAALLEPFEPGSFGDGVYLDPEDLLPRAVGTVQEAVVARACPAGTRVLGPCATGWAFDCALTSECMADFPGDLADLLADLLGDALRTFATVARVRAIVKEIPKQERVFLRFKVRGERKEETDGSL